MIEGYYILGITLYLYVYEKRIGDSSQVLGESILDGFFWYLGTMGC